MDEIELDENKKDKGTKDEEAIYIQEAEDRDESKDPEEPKDPTPPPQGSTLGAIGAMFWVVSGDHWKADEIQDLQLARVNALAGLVTAAHWATLGLATNSALSSIRQTQGELAQHNSATNQTALEYTLQSDVGSAASDTTSYALAATGVIQFISSWKGIYRKYWKHFEDLQKVYDETLKREKEAKEEREQRKREMKLVQTSLERCANGIEDLRGDIREKDKALHEANEKLLRSEKGRSETEGALRSAEKLIEEGKERLSKGEEQIREGEKELAMLKVRLEKMAEEKAALQKEFNEQGERSKSLEIEREKLRQANELLEKQLANTEDMVKVMGKQVQVLEERTVDIQNGIRKLVEKKVDD